MQINNFTYVKNIENTCCTRHTFLSTDNSFPLSSNQSQFPHEARFAQTVTKEKKKEEKKTIRQSRLHRRKPLRIFGQTNNWRR